MRFFRDYYITCPLCTGNYRNPWAGDPHITSIDLLKTWISQTTLEIPIWQTICIYIYIHTQKKPSKPVLGSNDSSPLFWRQILEEVIHQEQISEITEFLEARRRELQLEDIDFSKLRHPPDVPNDPRHHLTGSTMGGKSGTRLFFVKQYLNL